MTKTKHPDSRYQRLVIKQKLENAKAKKEERASRVRRKQFIKSVEEKELENEQRSYVDAEDSDFINPSERG